ncbi:MAG: hypothetical protein ACJ8DC_19445 [Gemmatimonadales bacterium]
MPGAARAQLAPVGVPAGVLRIDIDGTMDIWDSRYRDGTREPLGTDLTSPALGSDLLPLSDADARLGRITGLTGYRLNLGRLTTDEQADVSQGFFGGALGVTRWLTIFGRMPLVRSRVQAAISLDGSTGDAGVNPGETAEATFFQELDGALATLGSRIAAGDYDANPATKALAQSTLASGTALREDLFGLLSDTTASPFVPTSTSTAGTAVVSRVTDLQSVLAGTLGVTGFSTGVALPTDAVTTANLLDYVRDPIGLRPGESKVTFRGDAEAGAAVTLLDHWDLGAHRGGARVAIQGLARFPTGVVARSDRLLALGTGDGQTDVEARMTADLGSGSWGVRLEGGFNRQLAADFLLRVAPPSQPFPSADLLTIVHRDPGDVVDLAVRPFVRLARTFAIQGSVRHWSRGADAVSYATADDSIADVSAAVLEEDTKASATVVGIGLTYSNPGGLRPGGNGLPVDAGWSYERVVKAGGGRVPNRHTMRAMFRVYFRLF